MELTSYLIMALALAAGAVAKGATGMGLPLVALPVLTAAFGLQHAVGLMVIPLIFTNAWQLWRYRDQRWEVRLHFLPLFLIGGVLGIVAGTWLLTTLPERVLVLSLGVILLVYVVMRLANRHFVLPAAMARRFGPLAGAGGGILQGATGISSPIGVTFIHAMSLERETHVFAVSAMFLVYSVTQLPSLWLLGVMQPSWLLQGVLALVPVLVFMPVGQALASRLSKRAFDKLILAFLALIGIRMVIGF